MRNRDTSRARILRTLPILQVSMTATYEYDMVVVGSGPGGQKAAIQGAKFGKRVALVDSNPYVGGVCLHEGTIPSKSFREAILHLSGYRERSHYGKAYRVKYDVSMADLTSRCQGIVTEVEQTIRSQLIRNKVEIILGFGSLNDAHSVKVKNANKEVILETEFIVLATGTRPWHPPGFDFDGKVILDSDTVLHMKKLPGALSVVGGGVIGSEYGSMFSALGMKVIIVEARSEILSFVDKELVDSLVYRLRDQRATIICNDKVVRCAKSPDGRAVTYLESGKRIVTDALLVSAGRIGNVEGLNLEKVGIEADARGKVKVDEFFRTSVHHIFAVGDLIGYPALASTAWEQGRRAACLAFGQQESNFNVPLPYGVFTIPEIGMVGKTEAELSAQKVPYETGVARFNEIERGKIIGENTGILKLLFHRGTLQLMGVHIIGEGASELVHVGQTVMGFQGGIDYLAHAVFNYPTLSQSYKVAALDGLNKVISTEGLPDEDPYRDKDIELAKLN